ncbi:MAG: GH1 family beta-glucosidase [Steroidobacteraceae bacterium]
MSDARSMQALSRRFPAAFVWGVASSAYQIEGSAAVDGKGASIWDEFCARPGVIADGSSGAVACDHYHRWEADLDLLSELAVGAYRFSISWPRIQPAGKGALNEAGVAFYERLIDGLLRRNIKPYATLYHWDLPAALQSEQGGWAARDTAYRFRDYAAIIARRFGDRIASFATHNEPWVTATLGHELGLFAPGVKNRAVATQVSHHCLLSHGLAAQAIRAARSDVPVGIVLNLSPITQATQSGADVAQAALEDGLLVRWYMDALFKGSYPADVLAHLATDAPHVEANDFELITQPLDFLGVNYYYPTIAHAGKPSTPAAPGAAITDMGWEVAPAGLTGLLLRLARDYRLPPLLITENGAAYRDRLENGRVEDEARRQYLESHVRAAADAIERGVDLRGYFVWSLLDNFEWASGYEKRFGLYYVDYATQARIAKSSAGWFSGLMRAFNAASAAVRVARP